MAETIFGNIVAEHYGQEIFEEIVSLLHCYSMKLNSNRKAKKIKEILEENDSSES